MAKINNSQVIQKLIDELRLYPGTDVIPTELAEKILPVFQINDQNVSVNVPFANIVRSADRTTAGTSVLFTTPATGKFFLTNIFISIAGFTTDEWIQSGIINIVIDGTTVNIAKANIVMTGTDRSEVHVVMNLQNPILLDQASVINFITESNPSLGIDEASATIVGYTSE